MTGSTAALAIEPRSPGLAERIWWGAGTRKTAEWAAEQGMNLMSSTLLVEDTGVPFDELQAEQIARLPRRLGRGRLGARAADLGQPERPPDRDRPRPDVLRRPGRRATAPTRSATSRGRSHASARATSASPT